MDRAATKDERMSAVIKAAIDAGQKLELDAANAADVRVEVWRRYDIDRDCDRVRIEISYEAKG